MTFEEAVAFLDNWFTALAETGKAKATPAQFSRIATAYNAIKAGPQQATEHAEPPKLANVTGK